MMDLLHYMFWKDVFAVPSFLLKKNIICDLFSFESFVILLNFLKDDTF